MSKTADQLKPNNGPVYAAAMYAGLCEIFHKHGYALAVHGSLARDLDLVAIPWAEKVSTPDEVIKDMLSVWALGPISEKDPETKRHGRIAYTIPCGFGDCFIDLSFMPATQKQNGEPPLKENCK